MTEQTARFEAARKLFEADYTEDLIWDQGLGDFILIENASSEWDDDEDVHEEDRQGRILRVISGDVISERLAHLWDDEDTRRYWLDRVPADKEN